MHDVFLLTWIHSLITSFPEQVISDIPRNTLGQQEQVTTVYNAAIPATSSTSSQGGSPSTSTAMTHDIVKKRKGNPKPCGACQIGNRGVSSLEVFPRNYRLRMYRIKCVLVDGHQDLCVRCQKKGIKCPAHVPYKERKALLAAARKYARPSSLKPLHSLILRIS